MLIYQKEETKDREEKTKQAMPKSIEDLPDSWRADPLEALARPGAQKRLAAALEEEVEAYLGRSRYERSEAFRGHRNGYGKKRRVTLGCGTIPVRVPRVRDRPEGQNRFESQHLAS